eukprot:362778-Chlamydomonas_euryale.AAC.3
MDIRKCDGVTSRLAVGFPEGLLLERHDWIPGVFLTTRSGPGQPYLSNSDRSCIRAEFPLADAKQLPCGP